MLRKIRTAVAIAVIAILTFGFIDFAGVLDNPLLQKIQFGPALLSLSIVTLVCLIAATLLLGRLYCSVICPLGIFQDFFNWLSKKFDKKKYGFKPEQPWLRWGVLAVLVIAWLFGFTFLVGLVEPYSAYGRMADELFRPVYLMGNNLLAAIAVGINFGVDRKKICAALEEYEPSNNRSQMTVTEKNHLIVDAYNANPSSMQAALENFKLMQAEHKMVILGAMRELGEVSAEEHQHVVDYLKATDVETVWLVGEEFNDAKCDYRKFKDVEEVKAAIAAEKPEGHYILIKGSNSTKLYQLPELL